MKVLTRVRMNHTSRSELVEWMKEEYKLTGAWSSRWYVKCFLDLGLLSESEVGIVLTKRGNEFLKTKNPNVILDILLEEFAGVKEILSSLSKKGEENLNGIHKLLEETHDFGWKTSSQTQVRLNWLIGLGYVGLARNKYFLTNKGKEVLEKT